MVKQKHLFVLVVTFLLMLLVAMPALSQGGNGHGKGKGNGAKNDKTEVSNSGEQSADDNQSELLGCQKNNPERLDCSSLEVTGYCDGADAVFIIRNTGEAGNGDMVSSTGYSIVVDGNTVETGSVQLAGATTMEVRYSGGGSVTLYADQQVGHPGSSHPQTTLNCGAPAPTEEPTEEPTQEPTQEPTEEPTQEPTEEPTQEPTPDPYMLDVVGECWFGDTPFWTITNIGGDMTSPVFYEVRDSASVVILSGDILLLAGEMTDVSVFGYGQYTLFINGSEYMAVATCEEPVATEEPTPDPYMLDVVGECWFGDTPFWTITNIGGDMTSPVFYEVRDSASMVVTSGDFMLMAYEMTDVSVFGYGQYTLFINGSEYMADATCEEPVATEEPTPDPYVLDVVGECWFGDTPFWTITNIGGDMTSPVFYEVRDSASMVVTSGDFMLMAYETTDVSVFGYGQYTLFINGSEYMADATCEEPVATEEPTPDPYVLDVVGECWFGDTPFWTITNIGGDMTSPVFYEVRDSSGVVALSGDFMLMAYETTDVSVFGYGQYTLFINGSEYMADATCEEPVATEEPTPDPYMLNVFSECAFGTNPTWHVSNYGGGMTESVFYQVTDSTGITVISSELMLGSGGSIDISTVGYGTFTLSINGGEYVADAYCEAPAPTEEPTPEPTPDPTEEPMLGCQKNNPERLDCSSLEVSGYCDGSTAVFVIRNTGEAGNGDMRAPTSYSIAVDGSNVENGSIQLTGGSTTEVRYDGGGTVTLVATQQVGHPGNSRPQTTLTCG